MQASAASSMVAHAAICSELCSVTLETALIAYSYLGIALSVFVQVTQWEEDWLQ